MKKIFVGFAIEDRFARDNLVHQSENQRASFEFAVTVINHYGDDVMKVIPI